MPVDSLALIYYHKVPILSRAGIAEIKDMMQLCGSGRMEEKHEHVCGSIAMYSTQMNCQE